MASVLSMKMTFDGETRRLRLARGSFAELSAAVRGAFPAVRGSFKLEYLDDEGDVCAVSDDATLSEMWAVLAEKGGTPRFNVSTVEPGNRRRHHPSRAPRRATGGTLASDVPAGAPASGLTVEERLATLDVELERLRSEFASCSGSRQLPDRIEQRIVKIREKFVERAARMQRDRPADEAARRCDDLQAGTAERLSKVVGRAIAHAASKVVEGEKVGSRRRCHGRRFCGGRRGCKAAGAAALAGEAGGDDAAQSQVVHRGVVCDGCGMAPIRGIRYKSATREDYDLCEACESQRWQDKDQLYLKIRHPEQAPKAIFAAVGGAPAGPCAQLEELMNANRTGAGVDPAALFGGCGEAGGHGPRCGRPWRRGRGRGCRWNRGGGGGQFGRFLRKMAEAAAQNGGFEGPAEWRRQQPPKEDEQPAAASAPEPPAVQPPSRPATAEQEREQLEAAIRASLTVPPATPDDAASAASSSSSAAAAPRLQAATNSGGEAPELRAHFVAHTTMAGRPTIEPGARFVKGWRVSNPGPGSWPRGTALIATEPSGLIAPSQVVVQRLPAVGETVDLTVEFQAPSQPGRYQSYWRLVTPSGEQFGHRLWADVFVANSNASQVLSSLAAGEPAAPAVPDAALEDEDEDDGVVVEPLERPSPAPSAPPASAPPAAAPQDSFECAVAELLSLGIGSEADVRAQLHRFRGSKDRAANALLASLQ